MCDMSECNCIPIASIAGLGLHAPQATWLRVTVTVHAREQVVGDLRQTPKGWFLVPVGQLTTQQREYTALHRAAATEVP